MKSRKQIFAVLIALILAMGTAAGCALKKNVGSTAAAVPGEGASVTRSDVSSGLQIAEEAVSEDAAYLGYGTGDNEAYTSDTAAESIAGGGVSDLASDRILTSTTLDILSQRKVIRNANLSIEVDDFYSAYTNLQAMINGIGYVSETNIHRDFYTYENQRRSRVTGEITVRVAANRFDDVLNGVKGLGEVIDDRIYSNDVTDQYFDTEGRLKVLKIEYDYLEEYMRTLTKPEDIFKTRSRMTELQTEIERLTGTLNKWNDLVELSTIYIEMTEKYPDEIEKSRTNTYWDRVKDAFSRSITGVVDALGNLLIFIIEAVPVLVLLAVAGWICYKVVKRIIKNVNGRKTGGNENNAVNPVQENQTSPEAGNNNN